MSYEAGFAIASVILSILLIVYFLRLNKMYNTQNGLFLALLIDNGLTSLCTVCLCGLRYLQPSFRIPASDFFSYVYFITHILMLIMLFLYLLSTIKKWRELRLIVRLGILVPISIVLLVVLSNPFTHAIYSYRSGEYSREPGIAVIYITFAYYFSLMVLVLLLHQKSFSVKRRFIFMTVLGLGLFSVLVQMYRPEVKVETVTITLCGLVLFLFVQNPTVQIDPDFHVYSRQAFLDRLRYNMLSRKRFDIIELILPDFDVQTYALNAEQKKEILKQISVFLTFELHNGNLYHTDQLAFVIELVRPEAKEVSSLIRTIRARFEEPWKLENEKIFLAGRMLRLILPTEAQEEQLVLGVMNRFEKGSSENRVLTAADFDLQAIERNQKITGALARAMEKKNFEMRYTPIYSMGLERIVAAEVSVRFLDEELGYVYDDEIYNYAERSGHALQLGEMIFEKSCEFIEKQDLKGKGLSFLGLRLHPAMCLQYGLMERLTQIAQAHHVDQRMICLLISEYTVSKASKAFKENLSKMAGEGLRFCLEDYGSGFTSITSIYELPFSVLKVNKSVMQATMSNEKARITMDSTLVMARDLSMMTMVEGIDEENQFEMISDMACDLAKGKYFFDQIDEGEFVRVLHMAAEKDGKEGRNDAV
ncbi:MAG: EAL domain-containing protein [Lachnospiraceae bacterium]|nr:EAL domain-containing protein [Lachnospiraceae bacterium]MBR3735307.1 EAL domain-containing protein [Lachnospiraceae bacterium]MBR6156763.1 EAL domain-containing protein [Lachnospiraceae bacterium]